MSPATPLIGVLSLLSGLLVPCYLSPCACACVMRVCGRAYVILTPDKYNGGLNYNSGGQCPVIIHTRMR